MPKTDRLRINWAHAPLLAALCVLSLSTGCTKKAEEATEREIQSVVGEWYVDPEVGDVLREDSANYEAAHPLLQTVYLGIFEDLRFQRHMIDHRGKLLSCEGAWRVRMRDQGLLLFETECRGETVLDEEINLGLSERIEVLDTNHIQLIDRSSGTRRAFARSNFTAPEHLEANWIVEEVTPSGDQEETDIAMFVLANQVGLQPMFRLMPDRSLIIQSPRATRRGAWQVVAPQTEGAVATVYFLLEQEGALSFQPMHISELDADSMLMVDHEGNELTLSAVTEAPEPSGVEFGAVPADDEAETEEAHEHHHDHDHDHDH